MAQRLETSQERKESHGINASYGNLGMSSYQKVGWRKPINSRRLVLE